jgi:D-alanine-D-alanine ligase-like ATP-grasp enzyme
MNVLGGQLMNLWRYGALARRVLTKTPSFERARERAYVNWWASAAAEMDAEFADLGQGYCRVTKGELSTIIHKSTTNIDTYLSSILVSNKPFVHELLENSGYKVPRYKEYDFTDLNAASDFMASVGSRCVVKPSAGWAGHGVTTGVNSRKRLRHATIVSAAASFRQRPMIEEQFEGDSFRLLYLGGRLIDAVKRSRPTVVGDGKSTIGQLIQKENDERLGSGPSRAFWCLTIDLDCKFYLVDKGLSLNTVPPDGDVLAVKNVANQNSNRDNISVRNDVHPYFHEIGRHVSSLLGVALIGLDIMARDLTTPLNVSGGMINEVNITPGLHHHELIANPEDRANVCSLILEYIFSGAKNDIALPAPVAGTK